MVEAYWNIGKSIIEEQGGYEKAEYGTGLLKKLSKQMTEDFGKGFTVANLKNMRQFYLTFPKSYALRSELKGSSGNPNTEAGKNSRGYYSRPICT